MSNTGKKTEISRILPLILSRPSIKVLENLKFFYKKDKNPAEYSNNKNRQSYTKALSSNIKEILKIKEIHKFINEPREKSQELI